MRLFGEDLLLPERVNSGFCEHDEAKWQERIAEDRRAMKSVADIWQ